MKSEAKVRFDFDDQHISRLTIRSKWEITTPPWTQAHVELESDRRLISELDLISNSSTTALYIFSRCRSKIESESNKIPQLIQRQIRNTPNVKERFEDRRKTQIWRQTRITGLREFQFEFNNKPLHAISSLKIPLRMRLLESAKCIQLLEIWNLYFLLKDSPRQKKSTKFVCPPDKKKHYKNSARVLLWKTVMIHTEGGRISNTYWKKLAAPPCQRILL